VRAHLDAVKALLAPAGMPVHYIEVLGAPTYPYVLLWTGSGRWVGAALCAQRIDLDDTLGVTVVHLTAEGVLSKQAIVRGLLDDAVPAVPGRHVDELRQTDSQRIAVDREVVVPPTNTFPKYGVDLYALSSTPA
jgi:hypothetical protein